MDHGSLLHVDLVAVAAAAAAAAADDDYDDLVALAGVVAVGFAVAVAVADSYCVEDFAVADHSESSLQKSNHRQFAVQWLT
jgi:hypothetical protein